MPSFSERLGITPIKSVIQIDSIDDNLRNSLWNAVNIFYLNKINAFYFHDNNSDFVQLINSLWVYYFKNRIDELSSQTYLIKSYLKEYFFSAQWYEVYNFIEILPNYFTELYSGNKTNEKFIQYVNEVLKIELSGYRFVDDIITPITNEEEIISIENSLNNKSLTNSIQIHLKSALKLISDRVNPDYRNSIKEAISAVEAHCKQIANKDKATLGEALKIIENNKTIHPALLKAFSSLYGYTSDADGIRHALLDADNLDQEDALFMIVSCSAFINLLSSKQAKIKSNL
ncbi:hypothetical protein L3556_00670 [Candidatus Synechococcus calcipolaris G9]|uniref:HEPN AbiJ-N-terminal domain-containing protein n=1 Tax=Candidatus Synechococcus calcipolaris G9 TaxID=1497997 RepID=A0ABT6EX19_9SYNE|nr:hypothetical protein [Candidatus Synechococcus calcipolaris]MDG2989450.1 hypothetical protein [Candidatus Synechococcus calcipolaris G9]